MQENLKLTPLHLKFRAIHNEQNYIIIIVYYTKRNLN